MKTCTRCGVTSDNFKKRPRKDIGVMCDSCRDARVRERNRQAQRRYRENNPDKDRERKKRWRDQNPDYSSDWYRANRDRVKASTREWNRRNPERRRANKESYRIRKQGTLTTWDLELSSDRRKAIANDPCFYCGTREGVFNVDHFFPVARGGDDRWSNLVRACAPCNLFKSAQCGTVFMMRRMNNG